MSPQHSRGAEGLAFSGLLRVRSTDRSAPAQRRWRGGLFLCIREESMRAPRIADSVLRDETASFFNRLKEKTS